MNPDDVAALRDIPDQWLERVGVQPPAEQADVAQARLAGGRHRAPARRWTLRGRR